MLLFLDMDGVMVPANAWRRLEILEDGFPAFSTKAVRALNRILSESGGDIVLTTSHKSIYSLNEWKDIFNKRNILINDITRLSENKNFLNRKDELLNWFHANKIKDDFIIIDDDKSLNALPAFLKDKLIQPSASVGLTEELADQALNLIAKSTAGREELY